MDEHATSGALPPQQKQLSLADPGGSVMDFLRSYSPPGEDRGAGGTPVKQTLLDAFVQGAVHSLAALPQRAFESSNRHYLTGEYDPAPIMEAAMTLTMGDVPFAIRGAVGSAGGKVTQSAKLPMDRPSRFVRSAEMGYDKTRFYRGDRHGDVPREFPHGAFFSRDRDTSAGVARQGGRSAPEEYRLNLQNAFRDHEPVTAEVYACFVAAARQSDPQFARELAAQVGRGKSVDWLMEFARRHPQMTVAESGALLRQAIEMSARKPNDLFRRAGFDALDFGRDVLKLNGAGIRSKDARFDPTKANDRDIMASLPPIAIGVGAAGAAAANYPNRD